MVDRAQLSAFERVASDGRPFTREMWLRDILGRDIRFQHRGGNFHYAPVQEHDAGKDMIVGRIGRQITVVENEPPEGHLAETERETWKAAIVLIDPTHHGDGQKVAVGFLPTIGRPIPIFESLANSINNNDEPFVLEVNAIVPSETFWNFVKAHEGQITTVQFEFVAPNMFGEADDYDREMRDMNREERAQKAKLALESKDGLNLNTQKIKRAADYTTKGAGSIRARTKNNIRYNSKDKAKKVSVPNKEIDDMPPDNIFSRLFLRIFRQ